MTTLVALLCGISAVGAALLLISAFQRPVPHLSHTLTALTEAATHVQLPSTNATVGAAAGAGAGDRVEQLGDWLMRRLHLTPSARIRAQLELRNLSTTRFYGERVAAALTLAAVPAILGPTLGAVLGIHPYLPVAAVLLLALIGWMYPAWNLTARTATGRADLNEALLVYIDLVVLERLSNASATEALRNAAQLSDGPLFTLIRTALERARLEQEQPWTELRRLADRIGLPQLGDVADVARLQDEGAALSDALRARVRELRNAWLVDQQTAAARLTSQMTIWLTAAAMIVAAVFVAPPLLSLVGQ